STDLINVIVADDGSAKTPELPNSYLWNSCILASQQDEGFRLAAVRNLGAAQGTSPVIVFLDCDVVPSPHWLEQHMNWHRRSSEAVTFGGVGHIDNDTATREAIATAIGEEQDGFWSRAGQRSAPAFVQGHHLRTNRFLSGADDLFYATNGGNLGVARALFDDLGGFDKSFEAWGGEDLDLTFRLFTIGADLIPVTSALGLHLGTGTSDAANKPNQREFLGHYIPHRSLAVPDSGRNTRDIQIDISRLTERARSSLRSTLSHSTVAERCVLVENRNFLTHSQCHRCKLEQRRQTYQLTS
ncbi:MAG: glycosyltransferase, partial [Acidimicrobiales bacterium]